MTLGAETAADASRPDQPASRTRTASPPPVPTDTPVTAQDISNLPRGDNTTITDVLAQMPGVAIDQNQQIHIRNTEGPAIPVPDQWSHGPPRHQYQSSLPLHDQSNVHQATEPARWDFAVAL